LDRSSFVSSSPPRHQDLGNVNRAGWYTHGPLQDFRDPILDDELENNIRELMYIKNWSRKKTLREIRLDEEELERQGGFLRRSSIPPSSLTHRYSRANDDIVEALMIAKGYTRREAQNIITRADIEADEEEAYREQNASRYRPAITSYGRYRGRSSHFERIDTTPTSLSREAREELRAMLGGRYSEYEVDKIIQNFDKYFADEDWNDSVGR